MELVPEHLQSEAIMLISLMFWVDICSETALLEAEGVIEISCIDHCLTSNVRRHRMISPATLAPPWYASRAVADMLFAGPPGFRFGFEFV